MLLRIVARYSCPVALWSSVCQRASLPLAAHFSQEVARQRSTGSAEHATSVLRSELTAEEKDCFWRDGFVVLPTVLSSETVTVLQGAFDRLFSGHFSTGLYPDEWHWREGISFPTATREICNAWKSDETIASVVLSARLGRLVSDLMDWPCGARLAQDDVLWKPAGGSAVGFHQDSEYISEQFRPLADNSVTVWMALDNADAGNGAVQYASKSHRWCRAKTNSSSLAQRGFHSNQTLDHLRAVRAAADDAGEQLEVVDAAVSRGGCVIHHQDTWHGSSPNKSSNRVRRALVGHFLRADVQFRCEPPPGYIYGRYKLGSSLALHDCFFPLVYRPDQSAN